MVAEQDALKADRKVVCTQENVGTLSCALNVSYIMFFIGLQVQRLKIQK